MKIEQLQIEGAKKLIFPVHKDDRGFFREWFKASRFFEIDPLVHVKQANMSLSRKGVIRGIHFSIAPEGQAKFVTLISGHITNVLVDLRIGSPTYLNVVETELTEETGEVIFIPTGVGHGFAVHSECARIVYLTSGEYSPEFEKSISPTDSDLGIDWKLSDLREAVISESDSCAPSLAQLRQDGKLPYFL